MIGDMECNSSDYDIGPVIDDIAKACDKIGWPCFLRTDLGSAKHSGPSCYLLTDKETIKKKLFTLAEDQEMKFWMQGPPPAVFMVRQFLDLDYSFVAFDGLPISREWRIFANPDGLICAHPYWPEHAIKGNFHGKTPKGWTKQLKGHHREPGCMPELISMAIRAAKVCDGEWSVDFAMDKAGKWWLIDMAVKDDSWHWPGCPNSISEKGGI